MEFILKIADGVARMPDAVSYLLCPVLLIFCTFLLLLVKGKKLYPTVALLLGAGVLFFTACEGDVRSAVICISLYIVEAALLRFLLSIKLPKRRAKKTKTDKMYEKFHLELDAPQECATPKGYPPKVCCFEDAETRPVDDGNLRLKHATDLVDKLLSMKLAAGDRLEADTLARTIDAFRDRPLSENDMRSLNDCLASVLKLTAKYQL